MDFTMVNTTKANTVKISNAVLSLLKWSAVNSLSAGTKFRPQNAVTHKFSLVPKTLPANSLMDMASFQKTL